MKKSSVCRMERFMYSRILCYALERWIRTQHQILFGKNSWVGSRVHHNTQLWTQLTESRWNSSGIFSQDSPHCSSSKKSKSSWPKWATHHNSKDEVSSCRCSMTSYGELQTMFRNVLLCHTCVCICKKISSKTLVIPRTWIRKEVVFYLHWQTTRRMGQSRWIDDDQIRRKRTPSFPSHESIVSRNAQKQRRWTIIYTFLCRWRYDWNCFSQDNERESAQYLRSSLRCVWGIQCLSSKNGETRIGRTIWPIVRASRLIDNDTQTFDWDSCTRKFIAKVPRTSGKASATRSIDQNTTDAGFLTTVEVGQSFMRKGHWRVITIYRTSDRSWVHFAMGWKKQLTRKVGFEGTQKLDPCWKYDITDATRRTHELALCDRCHTAWASGEHVWVPAWHPRYTCAPYGEEAVGGSLMRRQFTTW